jgi:hypothetical protein
MMSKWMAIILGCSVLAQAASAGPLVLWEQGTPAAFPLVAGGRAVPVWVDGSDFKVARIAAELLADDVARVSGVKPVVLTHATVSEEAVVLVGTLGHSTLIDRLVLEKKLDVGAIRGQWEAHLIATVKDPLPQVKMALVIVGSDRRGTAYGVFTLSEALGVSPWYWWADVTPVHRTQLFVDAGSYPQASPSVKYRGIFINDEFAGLHPWASKTFEKECKHIGPKTYAKIFELLLRLKANFCWPAMWGGAKYFNVYPENKLVADDYAIVMGSSHCESLLFNNVENAEWDEKTDGPWNFLTNREKIEEAWTKRLKENGTFENVYTLGLRGIHDRPIQGGSNVVEKVAILQKAIDAQRELLRKQVNPNVSTIPQIFVPYREVLKLYEAGVKVPDEVTLVWADDNYGFMRQVSTPEEQKRAGHSGVYYHLSFFNNIWLCPYSPALTAYELTKAYTFGADRLWVINIGDIKPAEKELTFAMQLAWDIKRWTPQNAYQFTEEWAGQTFGKQYAVEIAAIIKEYYRLNARGVPEFLNRGQGFMVKYSDKEMSERLESFHRIATEADALAARLPEELKDAFYQLVQYPVLGAGLINDRVLLGRQSLELAAKGDARALELAERSKKAFEQVRALTTHYNRVMAKGKWNHMMEGMPNSAEIVPVATLAMVEDGKAGKTVKLPSFSEPEPVAVVAAKAFARKHEPEGGAISILPWLGYTEGGLALLPFTLPSTDPSRLAEGAWLEYEIELPQGDLTLAIRAMPTQRLYKGRSLSFAVSLNGGVHKIFDIHSSEGEGTWWENVKRGYSVQTVPYGAEQPRKVTLRLYLPDPGVVLQDIQIFENRAANGINEKKTGVKGQ